MIIQISRSSQQQSWATLITAWILLLWEKVSRSIPTRSSGWPEMYSACCRRDTFRSGDGLLYSAARDNLIRRISKTRSDYRTKMEDQLSSNSIRQIWQGNQHITNYRPNLTTTTGNPLLAEKLNHLKTGLEVIGCKCSCKNHQALWWNWPTWGPAQERKTKIHLYGQIASKKSLLRKSNKQLGPVVWAKKHK